MDQWRRDHYEWRKKVNPELPKLAARVFALRDKTYPGCGFHWSLERLLGTVISNINDYDKRLEPGDDVEESVLYEELVERIEKAEAAVKANEPAVASVPPV